MVDPESCIKAICFSVLPLTGITEAPDIFGTGMCPSPPVKQTSVKATPNISERFVQAMRKGTGQSTLLPRTRRDSPMGIPPLASYLPVVPDDAWIRHLTHRHGTCQSWSDNCRVNLI